VILRIDSPGGDATASDEILRDVRALSKAKPVVISFSDVAASGGYYIAMSGDPIVAYPGTLTGSIGVIYGKVNLRGLYDKIGISKEILKRGRFADIDSDYQPLTPAGREKLRESIGAVYDSFLERVGEGRKLERKAVQAVAQGRVWTGEQARERKLVDELGGLTVALDRLKERLGVEPGERVSLVSYPRPKTWFEVLFGPPRPLSMLEQQAPPLARLGAGIAPWLQGGLLRVAPYRIEVR
jgi:protease-4